MGRGAWGEPGPSCLWCGGRAWSNETRSFTPPVTQKLSDALSSGDRWEESAEPGIATFPKLMSYHLKLSWGGLCWAQQPCLACFLPKASIQLTQVPEPQCSVWDIAWASAVWYGALRLLVWALPGHLFSACSPWESWHLSLTREPQRWQESSLGRKACFHPYLGNSESAPL